MNKTIRVAAAQASPVFLNKAKTVDKACDIIRQAGAMNAQLVVFPEAFVAAYPDWIWLIPNSKSTELNRLYVELGNNAVTIPDEFTTGELHALSPPCLILDGDSDLCGTYMG